MYVPLFYRCLKSTLVCCALWNYILEEEGIVDDDLGDEYNQEAAVLGEDLPDPDADQPEAWTSLYMD